MPMLLEADKVVGPALKAETQARAEGITKPILVIAKSVPQPQKVIPPVLPRKGQGKTGARGKIIRPKSQPTPQPQPSPTVLFLLPSRPEPPPTAILTLAGRPPPKQLRYKL